MQSWFLLNFVLGTDVFNFKTCVTDDKPVLHTIGLCISLNGCIIMIYLQLLF